MKNLLILLLMGLSLALSACATSSTIPDDPGTAAATKTAEDAATKTVVALGQTLYATPGIVKSLYDAGKVSKEQYNEVVPIYNQALASYAVLNKALQAAIDAGKDPADIEDYAKALLAFMTERNNIDNIITSFGGLK